MLFPADPKSEPQLLISASEMLRKNDDHVVILDGVFNAERRSDRLKDEDIGRLLRALENGYLSRICGSKGTAIPPYFAFHRTDDGVKLTDCDLPN